MDWRTRGNFFTEAILCFNYYAVSAFFKAKGEGRLSAVVGGETLLGYHLAQLPRVNIGHVRFRFELWSEEPAAEGDNITRVD